MCRRVQQSLPQDVLPPTAVFWAIKRITCGAPLASTLSTRGPPWLYVGPGWWTAPNVALEQLNDVAGSSDVPSAAATAAAAAAAVAALDSAAAALRGPAAVEARPQPQLDAIAQQQLHLRGVQHSASKAAAAVAAATTVVPARGNKAALPLRQTRAGAGFKLVPASGGAAELRRPSPSPPPTCMVQVVPQGLCGGARPGCVQRGGCAVDAPWTDHCCPTGQRCVRQSEQLWSCQSPHHQPLRR
jgi:hypothetical protein